MMGYDFTRCGIDTIPILGDGLEHFECPVRFWRFVPQSKD
jgi:hypothetical protein